VQVYFAQVNEAGGVCADMKGRCFTTEEFARLQIRLYEGWWSAAFAGSTTPIW